MENPTPQTPLATADAAGTATLAAEQERSRILGIQSILAGSEFDTVRNKAIAEGWDVSRAKAEAFDVAQTARLAEQKAAGETQAAMQQRLDAIAKSGHAEELVPQADTTPDKPVAAIASGAGSADAFETSVKAHVNAGKTLAAAQSLAAKESPANHRAWILASQKR